MVQIPFKDGRHVLYLSKANAMKPFTRLYCTLRQSNHLYQKHSALIQELFDLGHSKNVQPREIGNYPNFNLHHHCYLKEDVKTTCLRVVFEASAKITIGAFP